MIFLKPTEPVCLFHDLTKPNQIIEYNLENQNAVKTREYIHKYKIEFSCTNKDYIVLAHRYDSEDFLAPGVIELRNWSDFSLANKFEIEKVWFQSISISDDSNWIAFSSTAENINLLDTRSGELTFKVEAGEFVSGITFAPGSQMLSAISTFQGAGYINLLTQQDNKWISHEIEPKSIDSVSADFSSVFGSTSFRADSQKLISCISHSEYCEDKTWWADIQIIDIQSLEIEQEIYIDQKFTKGLARSGNESAYQPNAFYLPDQKHILVGCLKEKCLLFNSETGNCIEKYQMALIEGYRIYLEPNANRVWTVSQDHNLVSFQCPDL